MTDPRHTQQNLVETEVSSEVRYQGSFLNVRHDQVSLPNGEIASREYILHPGAVVVIPLLDDGRVLMEKQYRYPLRQVFIEFPAGKIDAGEDPLVCAQRELQEETGYQAEQWQFICTIHNAIAYADEHLDLFLAKGLTAGAARLDEEEFLETFAATPAQLMQWVREGVITDVKTVIGIFWLEKILAGQWQLEKSDGLS